MVSLDVWSRKLTNYARALTSTPIAGAKCFGYPRSNCALSVEKRPVFDHQVQPGRDLAL